MSWISIELDDGRTAYRPGEEVSGVVLWVIDDDEEGFGEAPEIESAEVRLIWFTRGRGDRDSGIVAAEELPGPQATDRRPFRFRLPEGPYSVSGKLVSLVWAVEAVIQPGDRAARTEITVSPTGREVMLYPDLETSGGGGPHGGGGEGGNGGGGNGSPWGGVT
jgi:hypothetical protein